MLDTNVRGILARIFLGQTDAGGTSATRLWRLAEDALPKHSAYSWNQALMDLGATVCTARSPSCPACPVREICGARITYGDFLGGGLRKIAERRSDYRVRSSEPPRRIVRGRIIQMLREAGGDGLLLELVAARLRPDIDDASWLLPIADGLACDGLLEVARMSFVDASASSTLLRLPSEQSSSNADPHGAPGSVESA